tara:strand:+ start:213 stop:518 length:306 start_codon:yes stop_codon:yes gene_type:complete
MDKYIIYGAGFPPQYYVLEQGEDGVWKSVFGPDPDLVDAQAKIDDLNGVRARNDKGQLVGDDPSTPNVNEAYASGKAPKKKKAAPKKKAVAKKKVTKKGEK